MFDVYFEQCLGCCAGRNKLFQRVLCKKAEKEEKARNENNNQSFLGNKTVDQRSGANSKKHVF